ncbi:MAG: hypothetical protein ACI9Y1_001010 [Lentisphaeria bacterium]|jgi:hypothetical protein
MLNKNQPLNTGDQLASPAGRALQVADIFVPRSNREKSKTLPSRFRSLNRKIVIFVNGSMAPLADIEANYRRLG